MKKVIFTLLSFCVLYATTNAQYCGNNGGTGSGTSQCTPSGTLTHPGLAPVSDSLPPVVNGVVSSTVIQFKNFDTITFGGQHLTVTNLRLDSLGNLPTGLCWATNKTNNTWANQEDGCIKINGTTCSDPGQYKLKIIVTAYIPIAIQTDADAAGLKYFVRVVNSGDATIPVDTTQTVAFNKISGYSASANCGSGISDINNSISSLMVVPNPMNSTAKVSFFSDKSEMVTERLTNIIGSEVFKREMDVRVGENVSTIERGSLPTGVYFYSLTNGKSSMTKRVVIE